MIFSIYSKIESIIGSDHHKTKYLHITIERKNSLTIVSSFFFGKKELIIRQCRGDNSELMDFTAVELPDFCLRVHQQRSCRCI